MAEDAASPDPAAAPVPAQPQDWARLLSASPLPLAWCDPEGIVRWATPAWCAWFGQTPAVWLDRPYAQSLPPARAAPHRAALARARLGDSGHLDDASPDSSPPRWARIHFTPESGTRPGVLLSLQDQSAERRGDAARAAELQKARTLLDWRTAMLQERNDMLQLLSHEIRQPLNNASAAMQATMKAVVGLQSAEAAQAGSALLRAEHVLQQVIGTLDNTLAAGTTLADGAHPLSECDLPTLVKLAVHDIAADARARIAVEWRTGTRTVQLHPALMRLSLRNLLNNALAYSPPQAPVRLRIDESDEPLALHLEVVDQGPGIPDELRPRLFDKGSRGTNARHHPGVGLGLFIVQAVARLHQGSIEALPAPGGGTIMRLTLPQGLAD